MKFYSHERVLFAWVGKIVLKIGIADNPFIFFEPLDTESKSPVFVF